MRRRTGGTRSASSRTSPRSDSWPEPPEAELPPNLHIGTWASRPPTPAPSRLACCKAKMQDAGRLLLVLGVLLALIGGALMLFGRFHLPGDLTFRSGGGTPYIPLP